jgi:O-antigen/teichoic acid export membrane protein
MGAVLPAMAMLVTLPVIVHQLGTEQYGLLTLVMAITGYFALVDINVTAGSVKYIAEYHAQRDFRRMNEVITFGALFYVTLGALGFIGILFATPSLVDWFMKLPPAEVPFAMEVMHVAAFGFFFSQLQTYANSIPQSVQAYGLTARAEMLFGVLVPVATAGLLLGGGDLLAVVVLRVVASGVHFGVLVFFSRRLLPEFRVTLPSRGICRLLLAFSGYSYLSRLAAVTHAHADKLIVGSLLGLTALAYYNVATQIASRLSSLNYRLSSVLYPAASAMQTCGEMKKLQRICFTATSYLTFLNGAGTVLLCLFGREILFYWMGADFAREAYWVMVFVAIAFFFDSLTMLPSLINDAFGLPRNTGAFAVLRTIIAVILTYVFARHYGIEMVALAQTLAALLAGGGFLAFVHGRSIPWRLAEIAGDGWLRPISVLITVALITMVLRPEVVLTLREAALGVGICTLAMAAVGILIILEPTHREEAWEKLRLILNRQAN